MTEQETKMILAMMRQNYKNAKIDDPSAEVALWMLEFGEYPAQVIKTAVEFYMSGSGKRSDFWPTTASIRRQIPRAESFLQFVENNKPRPELIDPNRQKRESAELNAVIEDQIALEREIYGDDDDALKNFLPYEK